MSAMLIDELSWAQYPIPATAASPTIALHVGRVGSGSPVGLLVASQHGDEGPWGTRAIRKLLESTPVADLRGTLRVVPVANPLAFAENSRTAHIDGEDVNMEFPGDAAGKHTQRLAHVLATQAVDGANIVLDVHGGGSWCINCFVYRFAGGYELAEAIAAPFIRNGPERGTTSLTGYAMAQGAKAVWIEVGGAGANEERWAQRIADGLRRALGLGGVLSAVPIPAVNSKYATGDAASLRASAPGLYLPALGEADIARVVDAGTVIGRLIDPVTNTVIETFSAPFVRTAVLLLRPTLAVLEGGEMVCVLAAADAE